MLLSLGMLMLSATQIYTIFTVQLFAFLNLLPVEADITAVSKTSLMCVLVCMHICSSYVLTSRTITFFKKVKLSRRSMQNNVEFAGFLIFCFLH